jgi:hypothetical protein
MSKDKLIEEEWKKVENFEYQVSNLGRIMSLKKYKVSKNRVLKLTPDKEGYLFAHLYTESRFCRKRVHRLVFETFIRKLEEHEFVHHIDKNPKNNNIHNLEAISRGKHTTLHHTDSVCLEETKRKISESNRGKIRFAEVRESISRRGEKGLSAKLTKKQVHQIHMLIKLGSLNRNIAKEYNISASVISGIRMGRTWKDVHKTFHLQASKEF